MRATVWPPAPERHADADLVRPPRHVVGHQAEEADRRECQRERAEERVGVREQPLLREPTLDVFGLRRDVRERQRARPHVARQGAPCSTSAVGSPAVRRISAHAARRALHVRLVDGRRRRVAKAVVLRVANDADDLDVGALLACSKPNRRPSGLPSGNSSRAAVSLIDGDLRRALDVARPRSRGRAAPESPASRRSRGETDMMCTLVLSAWPGSQALVVLVPPESSGRARQGHRPDARDGSELVLELLDTPGASDPARSGSAAG